MCWSLLSYPLVVRSAPLWFHPSYCLICQPMLRRCVCHNVLVFAFTIPCTKTMPKIRIRHGRCGFFLERGGDAQESHPFLEFGVGVACHDVLGQGRLMVKDDSACRLAARLGLVCACSHGSPPYPLKILPPPARRSFSHRSSMGFVPLM